MNFNKPYSFLKKLPKKLNDFYKNYPKKKIQIFNKSSNKNEIDPVTNLDRNFEKYIRSLIVKSFPKDSIIGEEYKNKISSEDYIWTIDPIDGTKAFISGVPTWSNLVGLIYKDIPKIGLANFPDLKRFFINNEKYSFIVNGRKFSKIKSSRNTNSNNVKVICAFHGKIKKKIKKKITNKLGSNFSLVGFDAYNYCLLACGKIDVVIETNLKSYDILPLAPIVKNSGGIMTTWQNKDVINGGNILATGNKKLHNKFLKILKTVESK